MVILKCVVLKHLLRNIVVYNLTVDYYCGGGKLLDDEEKYNVGVVLHVEVNTTWPKVILGKQNKPMCKVYTPNI